MESQFQKYLLCEQNFGVSAKKSIIGKVKGFLDSFKADVSSHIRTSLEKELHVTNYDVIGEAIIKELGRLNDEYMKNFTEFMNTRKF